MKKHLVLMSVLAVYVIALAGFYHGWFAGSRPIFHSPMPGNKDIGTYWVLDCARVSRDGVCWFDVPLNIVVVGIGENAYRRQHATDTTPTADLVVLDVGTQQVNVRAADANTLFIISRSGRLVRCHLDDNLADQVRQLGTFSDPFPNIITAIQKLEQAGRLDTQGAIEETP